MYEDLLEDLVKGKIKDVREGLSPLNFHQTCASLWFMVTCLNIPSVVYWVKNFRYELIITVDFPHQLIYILLTSAVFSFQLRRISSVGHVTLH